MATVVTVACLVFVSLSVRALLGFGFSLLFVPLASFVLAFDDVVRLAIVYELLSSMLMVWTYRRDVNPFDAVGMKVFALGGSWTTALLRDRIPEVMMLAAAMTVTVIACIAFLLNISRSLPRSRATAALAGTISGVLATSTSMSGPPVVLYYLATERSNVAVKGRLSGYFILVYMSSFAALFATGQYSHFTQWPSAAIGCALILIAFPVVKGFDFRQVAGLRKWALIFVLCTALLALVAALLNHR